LEYIRGRKFIFFILYNFQKKVINHFTTRVEALISANSGSGSPTFGNAASANTIANNASVSDILEAIKKTAIEWPTDRLKRFPDLRFKYIEVNFLFILYSYFFNSKL
jgi:hypothetical protein